jgi:hypothetical protein
VIKRVSTRRPEERPRTPPSGAWIAILAVGASLRLAAAWLSRGTSPLAPDPRLAEAASFLAHGLGLSLAHGSVSLPTASVPPIPPALLAAVTSAAGPRPELATWLGCAIGALLPLAVGRLGVTLFGPTTGRVAAWCAALDPLLIQGSGLLEESVLAAAVLLALVSTAEWLRQPRGLRALATGLAWGACTLCGTASLVLPPIAIAWAWGPLGLVVPPPDRLRQVALCVAGMLCVLAPWCARNAVAVHGFFPVTTSAGTALLAGNNAEVWSAPARRGGRIDVLRREPFASELAGLDERTRDARARAAVSRFVAARGPREWAGVAWARLARLWSSELRPDDPAEDARRPRAPWRIVLVVLEAGLALLAAVGVSRSLSGARRWFQALPALSLAALTLAPLLVSGSLRYRLGFEPLVALFAGIGVQRLRRLALRRRGLRVITRRTETLGAA